MNEFRALRIRKRGTVYRVQKMDRDSSWKRRLSSTIVSVMVWSAAFLVLDKCFAPGLNYLETEIKAGYTIGDISIKDSSFRLKSSATIAILLYLMNTGSNSFFNIFRGQPVWTDLTEDEVKKLFEHGNHLSKMKK